MSVTQEECGVDFSDDKLGMGDTLRRLHMYCEMYRDGRHTTYDYEMYKAV
jgi:hypothetical protein